MPAAVVAVPLTFQVEAVEPAAVEQVPRAAQLVVPEVQTQVAVVAVVAAPDQMAQSVEMVDREL